MNCRWIGLAVMVGLLWLQSTLEPVRAQLATSFYTVTGVETKQLPNAVQITIRTDGAVKFGGDLNDWIDIGENSFDPKPITSLRLRLVRARAKLPAFIDIGAYPVDSARVTLGRSEFARPYFSSGGGDQPEPRVDIELRFFVPILVRSFVVERLGDYDRSIEFGDYLAPLEARVEPGQDRRSIIITVITDRTDVRGAAALRRSPPEGWKHRLQVRALGYRRLQLDVLHQPLSRVLSAISGAIGVPMMARQGATDTDISLWMPNAGVPEILRALESGYGLSVQSSANENDENFTPANETSAAGWILGRDGAGTISERIPLRHLMPSRARLLFPDFLLSMLRADEEKNALIATGPRVLVERIRRDIEQLDRPRVLLRVQASVYEIARSEDWNFAFRAAYGNSSGGATTGSAAINPPSSGVAFDSDGQIAVRIEPGTAPILRGQLEALRSKGRAKLRAQPFVVVLSGESGTLFLGQTRFVPVLRSNGGRQDVQALAVSVGYSLSVRAIAGALENMAPTQEGSSTNAGNLAPLNSVGRDSILIDVAPRISTVDDIERGTGLPTLGIREISSSMRVSDGDEIVIAGLDSILDSRDRSRRLPRRRDNKSDTRLIVLLRAQRI